MNTQISRELQIYNPEVFSTKTGEMLAVRFDVRSLLEAKVGPDWQQKSCEAILGMGRFITRIGDDPTLREPPGEFGFISLEGDEFAKVVPGIWELYKGTFKQMMQAALPAGLEPLHSYDDQRLGLEPVAQPTADPTSGTQNRYEAHIDQRYTGVLVLDAPDSEKQGGRLVIGNKPDTGSRDIELIKADPTYISHRPGTLVCFSRGRFYPHYTEEITDPHARRITISLNYPVEGETSESAQRMLNYTLGKQPAV